MLKISPYDTTYGHMINISKVIKELQQYLIITNAKNLNYEFAQTNKTHLVFITGFSKEEQALPVFEHPVVYKNLHDELTVCIDVRQYVIKSDEQPINIIENLRDKNAGLFVVTRGLITYDFALDNLGKFRNLNKSITASFGLLISNLINIMVNLDPLERTNVELVAGHYINAMMSNVDNKEAIAARLANTRFTLLTPQRNVLILLDSINLEVSTFEQLVENIKSVLPDGKKQLITTTVIVNAVSSYWYGPGRSETMVIGLEHVPTWITLLLSCVTDVSFKHSKLATILAKYNKNIEASEIPKWFKLYIQENKI